MNFDEIWNDDGALSSCSRDDAEYFYNEGARCQQAKIDQLNKKNSEEKRILHNVIEMNQSKIDELRKRIDDLKAFCIKGVESNMLSIEYNQALIDMHKILKGNKDEI